MTSGKFISIVLLALICGNVCADDYEKIIKALSSAAGDLKIKKVKVAVMPFSAIDGRHSFGGKVVSERLISAMGVPPLFDVVERSLIDKLLAEQKLALSGAISGESAQKIGSLTGAGAILSGTMNDLKGGRIEVNVRLILAESGKIIASTKRELKKDWIDYSSESTERGKTTAEQQELNKAAQDESFSANEEGLIYLKSNRPEEAIAQFTRAIQLNPFVPVVYSNRGAAYFSQSEYRKAVEDFSNAIERDPTNAVTYNNRGAACLYLREYERAVQNFSKAIELAPDYVEAYSNRADAYAIQGFFDNALKDYDRAIQNDPIHIKSWLNRGSAYFRMGNLNKALDDYSKAVEFEPESVEALTNRGYVLFDLKRYDESVRNFIAVTKLNAKAKDAYAGLGISYMKLGKLGLAKSNYKKAIALDQRYKDKISSLTSEGHFYTPTQQAAFRDIQLSLK